MLGASRRTLLIVVAAALTVGDASARTIRRSCRDGASAQRAEGSGRPLVACDVGASCDGVCAFELPVCGPESCRAETFTVPAGSTRRELLAVSPGAATATLLLRCRATARPARCFGLTSTTVTTTTGGSSTTGTPPPTGPTTTTRPRLARASTTTSSTVTTTSNTIPTTTTTILIRADIPCRNDADCDGLATACAVAFCADDGFCAQACVCRAIDLGPTCSLNVARSCLTPDDCIAREDPEPACRECYLNLCRTVLVPDCFPLPSAQSPSFSTDFGLGF